MLRDNAKKRGRGAAVICAALALAASAYAQASAWSTTSVEPARFVAAHGRESALFGYPSTGLEAWAYPLQILSGYAVDFEPADSTQTLHGDVLLRRVEYLPDEVVRVYVGPDFVVHEHLFAPLHAPGVIVRYEVSGRGSIAIRVHFVPSLNLMWPGALGGQGIAWSHALHGYTLNEPLYGYSAAIASPQQVRHDAIVNRTLPEGSGYSLVMTPARTANGVRQATVYIGLDAPQTQPGRTVTQLESNEAALHTEADANARAVAARSITITTPDTEVNRALAGATLALDQAWVCNPQLGCGEVAGYGPSRPGRRPQYDWFFAGDGLVATDALLAEGDYRRARAELAFIARYQNAKNGMIWHEMSQSAALIDWQNRYPYMFVHVDITFQYLAALAVYARTTGDTEFIRGGWPGIARAYAYCLSTIDAKTGLPQIPAGLEGGDEQDRMRDDLGLSSEWIAAADGYAALARSVGNAQAAESATQAATRARRSVATHSWDAARHYWIAGHTVTGKTVEDQRPNPIGILAQHVFSAQQADEVLDQVASARFETDWGTRSMSSASAEFDPDSYSKGSVSALATANIAQAYWQQHRPLTAWQIWSGLVPSNTLDSMGHMHEVLAGDVYHPQVESVPEQTWSSAGFLSAAVHGLLGLDIDAAANTLTFAPRLPADWHEVTVDNIHASGAVVRLHLAQADDGWTVEAENSGAPTTLVLALQLPLGAALAGAEVNGATTHATLAAWPGEEAATLRLPLAAHADLRCRIAYTGGVGIVLPSPAPQLGEPSRDLRLVSTRFENHTLTIAADLLPGGNDMLTLLTSWKPTQVEGAQVTQTAQGRYTLRFAPARNSDQPVRAVVHFAPQSSATAAASPAPVNSPAG